MSDQELSALIASLQDKNKSTRTKAAKTLKDKIKSRWVSPDFGAVVDPLIAALKDEYWEVRYFSAEALGEIGDHRAIEPLIEALQSPTNAGGADNRPLVRLYIVQALGKLADYRAMQPLTAALKDDNGMVRTSAAEAIEKMRNNPKIVEQLVGKAPTAAGGAHEATECPKCGTVIVAGALYCAGCGYEPLTGKEGVGPFSFAFPAVENAYKPSGKGNQSANMIMLLIGLAAGIVGGAILPFIHKPINNLFAAGAAQGQSILNVLIAVFGLWVINIGLAALLGWAISFAVDRGTLIGKNRDEKIAKRIGLICGLVSAAVYVGVHVSLYQAEAFDSIIDIIRLAAYGLAIILIPAYASGRVIGENPFCEECGQFMKRTMFGKTPIRNESALMEAIKSGRFETIAGFSDANGKGDKNYSQVSFWHCESCQQRGFINIETVQLRSKYEIKDGKETRADETQTRLVFSSSLEKPAIEAITHPK